MMCQKIDDLYPAWGLCIDQSKVAEFIIGTGRKQAELANIIEFVVGCLDLCNLNGDMPTRWSYVGDVLTFYKVFYVAKPSFLQMQRN